MKPTVPEVIDRFRAYHALEPAWGSLHIVLDDDNTDDHSVDFCLQVAQEINDTEGAELAQILRQMSRTQRGKIARLA